MHSPRIVPSHGLSISASLFFTLAGLAGFACDVAPTDGIESLDKEEPAGASAIEQGLDDTELVSELPTAQSGDDDDDDEPCPGQPPMINESAELIKEGRKIFRFETFGDEAFWGDQLRLHEAIAGAANGGVGDGISPNTALALGLKVDEKKLPEPLKADLAAGLVDLDDPATTLALLELDAVIGLQASFDEGTGQITTLGITCSLCHTQVKDTLAPGIGLRRDGWPNRDLDVGAIVAAAPDLTAFTSVLGVDDATMRAVASDWGVGKFDAFVILDGIATKPDGSSGATLIPPLFGLKGVGLVTWNAFGSLASWIPIVINFEMHGQGVFRDPRLNDPDQFPIAEAQGFDRYSNDPDLVSDKLAALEYYVLSLRVPKPPNGYYDEVAAEAGEAIFLENCAGCHVPPLYTPVGWGVIPSFVVGVDSFQSDRSPNLGYRPPPLRGMFTREGGFFHDGRFTSVEEVVEHFNSIWDLGYTEDQKYELSQFLRSL